MNSIWSSPKQEQDCKYWSGPIGPEAYGRCQWRKAECICEYDLEFVRYCMFTPKKENNDYGIN